MSVAYPDLCETHPPDQNLPATSEWSCVIQTGAKMVRSLPNVAGERAIAGVPVASCMIMQDFEQIHAQNAQIPHLHAVMGWDDSDYICDVIKRLKITE